MSLNKRQKLFIEYYTDRTNKQTCGRGKAAALKAGYNESRAASQASNLLKIPAISQQIATIEKEGKERYQATKDQAILEARENYEHATTHTEKKYWYDMWVDLQSWKVQRSETTATINEFTSDESDYYTEFVRGIVKEREN